MKPPAFFRKHIFTRKNHGQKIGFQIRVFGSYVVENEYEMSLSLHRKLAALVVNVKI